MIAPAFSTLFKGARAILPLVVLLIGTREASAQTADTWQGTISGDWNNPNNWSVAVPGNTNNAIFGSSGATAVSLTATGDTAQEISFTGAAQAYTFSGNTLTLDDNQASDASTFIVLNTSGQTNTASQTFSNLVDITDSQIATAAGINVAVNLLSGTTLDFNGGFTFAPGASYSVAKLAFSNSSGTGGNTVNFGGSLDFGANTNTIIYFNQAGSTYSIATTATVTSTDAGDLRLNNGGAQTLNLGTTIGNMTVQLGSGSSSVAFTYQNLNVTGQNLTFNSSNYIYLDPYVTNSASAPGVAALTADYTGAGTSVTKMSANIYLSPVSFYTADAFNAAANNTLSMTSYIANSTTATGSNASVLINGSTTTSAGVTTITPAGTGTVIFGGGNNSSYATPTTVVSGIFLANATTSSTGVGSVTVGAPGSGATATMGGTGLVAPTVTAANSINVTSAGILAPGGSGGIAGTSTYGSPTGTLTFKAPASAAASFVNFASGAQLSFNLNTSLASSKLSLTSDFANEVSFANTVVNFTDLSGGTLAPGIYNLITDASGSNTTYSGLTLMGNTITGGLTIGNGLANYNGVYTESLLLSGGNIELSLAAVPEPRIWMLLLIGGISWLSFLAVGQRGLLIKLYLRPGGGRDSIHEPL